MEVTLESIEKNKSIYNKNIKKIIEQRAELIRQVLELRSKRQSLTDKIDIAQLNFEESKLIQQINDLKSVFKSNKLTLDQLDLQQNILESKIDRETYSRGMVSNRRAKTHLFKEQELTYCKNEVKKCGRALELYTLMRDSQSVEMWKKLLKKAQSDLSFAQQDLVENEKSQVAKNDNQEQQTASPHINESSKKIKPDNTQKSINTDEHYAGYTRTEEDGIITEKITQILKDYSGKQIGNRTIIEKYVVGGDRTIETTGEIENEDGRYTISEFGEANEDGELIKKQMTKDNKNTGQKEELSYQKDAKSETYSSKSNGKITFKITKTNKGISIDEYKNGQLYATYEYDENGKAIDGMGMSNIEQLEENYVENYFDSQVPYFEAENKDLPKQDMEKNVDSQTLLDSAIEATIELTKTSTINTQAQNIKQFARGKDAKSQGMGIDK